MNEGIDGKVVAITGASSGIGAATATLLAERGASVVLGARSAERLEALAGAIAADGGAVAQRVTDVRRAADVAALVTLAQERFGRLDVLINNAGVMPISPLDELRVADWDEMIDVNLRGVLHGIAAALPVFRAQGSGHVITTSSTSAHRVTPTMGVYSGTKMAVRAVSEALRQEAGGTLRVTIVSPGMTTTPGSTGGDVSDDVRRAVADIGMPADAVARAMAYAIEQPDGVDVGEVVIRPTAQT